MKKTPLILAFSLALVMCSSYGLTQNHDPMQLSSVQKLREAMQGLWADHVIWTHEYIVSALSDIPNTKEVAERLLKNQEDIGKAIVPYYSTSAGAALTKLLKEHILIAVDLVSAAKSGNKQKLEDADKRWHENAQDIASFLSKANPNWPREEMMAMLNQHLKLTADQATATLKQEWDKAINLYDQIRQQIQAMANGLSDGIVKQFPEKF